MDIPNTDSVNYAFASAQSQAMQYRHEFITPEHLLSALLKQVPFQKALAECFCTPEELSQSISEYLSKEVERVPQEIEYELEISGQLSELLQYAYMTISHSSAEEMDVPHLVQGMLQLEDSWAGYLLKKTVGEDMPEFFISFFMPGFLLFQKHGVCRHTLENTHFSFLPYGHLFFSLQHSPAFSPAAHCAS